MQRRLGFTLIELSLSIAFISILSLAVVLVITNAIAAYHRGLVLNQVNTSGTEVVDDMVATIQSSPVAQLKEECAGFYTSSGTADRNACESDNAQRFVSVTRTGTISIGGTTSTVPLFGAFCTGKYSYIWNSGYYFGDDTSPGLNRATLSFKLAGDETNHTATNFKLLKVQDESRFVCKNAVKVNYNGEINHQFSIDSRLIEMPDDVLAGGNLALYDLDVAKPAYGARGMLYSVSFILATLQGGININAAGDNCAPPEDYSSGVGNIDYCAINKFNFTAQAMGGE